MKKIVSRMENNLIFFQNKDVSEQLKIEGCVIVDFLLSKEIEALEEVYNKYKDEINNSVVNGIHMTNWISNIP
ncbi:MAG: hypothetical protein IPJ22_05595, partial [Bacteroidetes bacterium]|nr:hypothetical protein [Bacteroidota bacterium]